MLIRKNGMKYVFDFIEKCGYNVLTLPKYAVFAAIERVCAAREQELFWENRGLRNDDRNRILYPLS